MLTANTLKEWVHKVWDFDKPYRHVGRELGTGTQIGMSIGVALAHKGSGKLVIDLQPDGDLMFDLGALWMPIKYDIPDADRDVQQPRLLQRLGASNPHGAPARHRSGARLYRHGPRRRRRPTSRTSPKASAGTPRDRSKIPPKSARP